MRTLKDPQTIIFLVALPLGIVAVTSLINVEGNMVNGYNINATVNAVFNAIAFQFFSGQWLVDYLHRDFSGSVSGRLHAAPISKLTFFFATTAGIWVFTILQGVLIIAVTTVVFNAYWGNLLITALVFFIISIMAQLLSILIFLFTRTKGSGTAVSMVVIFGMMLASGAMFGTFGGVIGDFLATHGTPISLAGRAVLYSGFVLDDMGNAFFNIAVLSAITTVMAVAVVIIGRRRKI